MVFPEFLKKDDKVIMVSPAGVIDSILVGQAGACIKSWGLEVVYGENVSVSYGRYSGTPEQRFFDLQKALDDPDFKAIFCSRGGYGTIQILDKLNFDRFIENPKWVIGYSDITMLHARIQMTGTASIHGGMARLLAECYEKTSRNTDEPVNMLHDILFGKLPSYIAPHNELNIIGKSCGQLWGGNLAILLSLRGTKFDYIPEGGILFIEDTGEKPYAIERMLFNLKLGGVFNKISGLIVGMFSDYEEDPLMKKTVYEIISDMVSEYNFPVCFNFPVGHVKINLPLITGSTVLMEVNQDASTLKYI
jgi:muramoyltetrapeptide carboxypeptidase